MTRVTDGAVEWDTAEEVAADSVKEATQLVTARIRRSVKADEHDLAFIEQKGRVYHFKATHRWRISHP